MINDELERQIYFYVDAHKNPILASDVAREMYITTQKATVLLKRLVREGVIRELSYDSKKWYGTDEAMLNFGCSLFSDNHKDNSINVETIVENEDNVIEFEFNNTKESYKDKFLSLLYNIVYDYFY